MANSFSTSAVGIFHEDLKNTFSPLPDDHQITEVIKRIARVIFSPFAYLVLGGASLIAWVFRSISNSSNSNEATTVKSYDEIFFVRYPNITQAKPGLNDLGRAVKEDLVDYTKGFHKGASLYTPNSIQPFAVFDSRHAFGTQISVKYPFAFLIDPKVELHYWSLTDMDRNHNRELHEEKKQSGVEKYKPTSYHEPMGDPWKTIHFTRIDAFLDKIETVAQAAQAKKDKYTTSNGKEKEIQNLKVEHNEASITYDPHQNVLGILIRNTQEDIKLANWFKHTYKNDKGELVFENAFLAYHDQGKIIKI